MIKVETRDIGSGITGLGLGIKAMPLDQGSKFRKVLGSGIKISKNIVTVRDQNFEKSLDQGSR